MNNFTKRSITGALFVGITSLLILFNEWTFLTFSLLIGFALTYEFVKLTKTKTSYVLTTICCLASIIFIFLGIKYQLPFHIYGLLLIPILLLFIYELFANKETPLQNIAIAVVSQIYITVPILLSISLVTNDSFYLQNSELVGFYPQIIIGIFILIWTNDSMAYCVGMTIGKHRLFERVSPKKSWEGAIGGAVFTVVGAYFINYLFPILGQIDWVIISILVVVFGNLGDLIESLFKRAYNVKDSGTMLSGHGGFLDRFDSFLFAIPWVWIYFIAKDLF